jgi:peptide/nickel transport system substrate-binding protein
MNRSKAVWFVLSVLVVASMLLAACAPAPTPTATQAPAAQPTAAPAQPTAAPAEPTKAPEPTQAPAPTMAPEAPSAKEPTTWTYLTFGDPDTLDPHIDYETAGSGQLFNIYEGLITYDKNSVNTFIPDLATAIPDPVANDNGGVSYTWTLRTDPKFANGDSMTAEDVAYSFWRSMLIGDPNTPAFLLSEAFFDIDDSTQLVDPSGALVGDPEALKAAPAAKLEAACQQVKDAVTFDEANHTVTMNLVHPWGPFLPTLAGGGWAYVVDKAWVAEQGGWDGDCATWQNFYGIPSESGPIQNKTNGTGPYMLDHWTPQEEIVLVKNPNYSGPKTGTIDRVVTKNVNEFGTRFAALQAGDADQITIGSQADYAQLDTLVRDDCDKDTGDCTTVNPDGIVRRYKDIPSLSRTDIFFNFNVAEGSNYIGSGKLDGEGIPPDFFSDPHIRRAFNYCFDWETYIKDVQFGLGVQNLALTLPGQPGYDGTPIYTFDLAKCEEEFKAATLTSEDGKSVWDTGFYMQMAYNAGNTGRQAIAEILAQNLAQVNPNFFVAPVSMPWPTFLRELRTKVFPLATSGWQEDIHDPHNWYVPYLLGTYASRFNLPADLQAKYKALIDQGVAETDQAKRAEIYSQLNNEVYQDAPLIILSVATANRYEPLYVSGWPGSTYSNVLVSPPGGVWDLSKQ